MAAITIKDVPDRLHRRLRRLAEAHGRSLNREIIATLDAATGPTRPSPEDYLERVRTLRGRAALGLRLADIERAVAEGRS